MTSRNIWNAEQDRLITTLYPNETAATISKQLGLTSRAIYSRAKALGLTKSKEFLTSEKSGRRNLISHGHAHRFQPGHNTWNSGKKGLCFGGVATQFKKGTKPHNYKPLGSERTMDGYIYVKIAEPKTWVPKHHLLWKETYGHYPPKKAVLAFIDGNRQNVTIENLKLMTRQEWMSNNTIHQYPMPLKELIRLNAKVRRKINGK